MSRLVENEDGVQWFAQLSGGSWDVEVPKTGLRFYRKGDESGTYLTGEITFLSGQNIETVPVEQLRAALKEALNRTERPSKR